MDDSAFYSEPGGPTAQGRSRNISSSLRSCILQPQDERLSRGALHECSYFSVSGFLLLLVPDYRLEGFRVFSEAQTPRVLSLNRQVATGMSRATLRQCYMPEGTSHRADNTYVDTSLLY